MVGMRMGQFNRLGVLPFTSEKLRYKHAGAPTKVLLPLFLINAIPLSTLTNTMNVLRLTTSALAGGGRSTRVYSGRTQAESLVYHNWKSSKETLHKGAMLVRRQNSLLILSDRRSTLLHPRSGNHLKTSNMAIACSKLSSPVTCGHHPVMRL